MKSSLLVNLETSRRRLVTSEPQLGAIFNLSSGLAEIVIVNDLLFKLLPFSAEIYNW